MSLLKTDLWSVRLESLPAVACRPSGPHTYSFAAADRLRLCSAQRGAAI